MHDGVYIARVVASDDSGAPRVLIPQVFADTIVPLHRWVGDRPASLVNGIVAFVGGDPTYPVWLGATGA